VEIELWNTGHILYTPCIWQSAEIDCK